MAPSSNLTDIGEQSVNLPTPPKPYASIKLGAWCHLHQQPYREIASWNPSVSFLRPILPENGTLEVFQYERPKMFAGRVSGVSLVPSEGLVCTGDDRLIYEGLGARDYNPKADLGRFCRGSVGRSDFLISLGEHGPSVSQDCIFCGGNKNFGHFIFQNLLRLALLTWLPDIEPLPIAVYDDLPRRYYKFLDLLGFPESRRIAVQRALPTRFEKIWMLSSPMYRWHHKKAMIWPDAAWWLRGATAHLSRPVNLAARPRLYISRAAADWRPQKASAAFS